MVPDIATISAAASSIKTALDIAKALRDADISLEKAEFKLRLAELMNALADAKISLAEVVEELQARGKEVEDLQKLLEFSKNLIRVGEAYFEVSEDGKPSGDPYCSHCWESKRKAIHLHTASHVSWRECPSCKNQHLLRRVMLPKDDA